MMQIYENIFVILHRKREKIMPFVRKIVKRNNTINLLNYF